MPNRTILNKYGLFVSQVHKVLKKKAPERGDNTVINRARLVATLSSNHSWRVYRFWHNGDSFDKKAVREEIIAAFNDGWKEISENDVKEVVTNHIEEHALSMILTCFTNEERREYKSILTTMRKEFVDGIEPLESRELV